MRFFSGFGFKNEKPLFKQFLEEGEFNLAGFSYGAQRAFKEALNSLEEGKRINKLQLLSPAFFNYLPLEIKKKELLAFTKNPQAYLRFFYKKALYPALELNISPFKDTPTLAQLKELLFFEWKEGELKKLKEKGVEIEVFLGELDKIINPQEAYNFFKPFGIVYYIKGVGHLLRGQNG
ncbi:MAG: pimelyl-ACP methyl ester esterase BioV [Epsilonproteobacteria bacterium]|nr:pimelyl-ACP methyl ester esterase BioV [Campylobacterota bacterium]